MIALVYLEMVFQTLGFGVLALIAENSGFGWLAIFFAAMAVLTWGAPKLHEFAKKMGYMEDKDA